MFRLNFIAAVEKNYKHKTGEREKSVGENVGNVFGKENRKMVQGGWEAALTLPLSLC
jgi:hypothetical protein